MEMKLQSARLPAVVLLVQVAPEMAAKCATPGLGGDHRHRAERTGLRRALREAVWAR